MKIRAEEEKDWPAVYSLNKSSFETVSEADLVDLLRAQVSAVISLVAEVDQEVVGHIMFTPVSLSGFPASSIMGLAPMAVSSNKRSLGIGSALVRKGMEACRKLGIGAVSCLATQATTPVSASSLRRCLVSSANMMLAKSCSWRLMLNQLILRKSMEL